jgi:L-aminopeptidase/D-esterase-like protein
MKQVKMLPNDDLNPLFLATVQAVEESVVNALIAAKTMKGINDVEVDALPHPELQQVLRRYNRLVEPAQK